LNFVKFHLCLLNILKLEWNLNSHSIIKN
jgi:hypothetical protein